MRTMAAPPMQHMTLTGRLLVLCNCDLQQPADRALHCPQCPKVPTNRTLLNVKDGNGDGKCNGWHTSKMSFAPKVRPDSGPPAAPSNLQLRSAQGLSRGSALAPALRAAVDESSAPNIVVPPPLPPAAAAALAAMWLPLLPLPAPLPLPALPARRRLPAAGSMCQLAAECGSDALLSHCCLSARVRYHVRDSTRPMHGKNTMPLLDHDLFTHCRRIMTLRCGADLAV